MDAVGTRPPMKHLGTRETLSWLGWQFVEPDCDGANSRLTGTSPGFVYQASYVLSVGLPGFL